MRTIALAGGKGGSGKTTIATLLATSLMDHGPVALVDMATINTLTSRQSSPDLTNWSRCRNSKSPLLLDKTHGGSLLERQAWASQNGIESLIIDVPSRGEPQQLQAIVAADIVVIPTLPSQLDIWVLPAIVDSCIAVRREFFFVINLACTNSREGEEARAILARLGPVLPNQISNRRSFSNPKKDSSTPKELEPWSKAAFEQAELARLLVARMEYLGSRRRPAK